VLVLRVGRTVVTALRLLVTRGPLWDPLSTRHAAPANRPVPPREYQTVGTPAHLRGFHRISPRHIGWVCLMCVDCHETNSGSPTAAVACTEEYAAHRCGQPRRIPPGWGVSETPDRCVLCRRDTYVRSDRQRPCHPICAAQWKRTHSAPTGSARPVTA
jgi:hypothetical protein